MVRNVFADTAYFIALVTERDALHLQALQLEKQVLGRCFTTEWVLAEVANHLCAASSRYLFKELMVQLQSTPGMTIVPVKTEQFSDACELYFKRGDKSWSLTDCISFLTMHKLGIRVALTPDEDFEQAGFERLMDPRPRGVSEPEVAYGAEGAYTAERVCAAGAIEPVAFGEGVRSSMELGGATP